MNDEVTCVFCGTSTAELPAAESAQVRCNVREFGDETFTVWRCAKCGSLHSKDPIDYDRYYRNYVYLNHLTYDSIAKIGMRKRMRIHKRAGLKSGITLLDYGCGNGIFVRYAREHGVRAEGYDPYSHDFNDASVLDRTYEFVTFQDVLEHVDDPCDVLDDLKSYVAPGGYVAVGTPNADVLDLHNPLDHVGALHQPYHRHIPSAAALHTLTSKGGWKVVEFCKESWADTRVPFFNTAFLWRFIQRGGGYLDVGFELQSARNVVVTNPSLVFWGLFGSFSSRRTDMVVIARAPPQR
jgi:2-polyprenyl-3-methyl-5-hydroxy-6-metoxy-1,4-benzoquinol methylase